MLSNHLVFLHKLRFGVHPMGGQVQRRRDQGGPCSPPCPPLPSWETHRRSSSQRSLVRTVRCESWDRHFSAERPILCTAVPLPRRPTGAEMLTRPAGSKAVLPQRGSKMHKPGNRTLSSIPFLLINNYIVIFQGLFLCAS